MMINVYSAILVGVALRIVLAFSFYGSADATIGASFFDYIFSGYDVYSARSPWPYLPFSNALAWLWGYLAEYLNINVNLAYRLISSLYDVGIGVVVYQYVRKYSPRKAIKSLWLYMINPVTIFIVSLLGFTDSTTIFFLLLTCYFSDYFKGNNSIILSAVCLAISISVKPFTFIFIPFFLFGSSKKWLYASTFTVSLLILNSYYLLGASIGNLLWLFKYISNKTLMGHQIGTFGFAPILSELGTGAEKLSILSGLAGMVLIVVLYIVYLRKMKAVEFCFLVFFVTLLFSNHIHAQYLLWIVPFAIIGNNNKSWPFVVFMPLILIAKVTVWYTNMGAFSPHIMLGSFLPTNPDSFISLLFGILNNIWIRNIIYLIVVALLIPSQVLQNLSTETEKFILEIKRTFNWKKLFIAAIIALVFGIIFYLIAFRFYFVINSYPADEFSVAFLLLRNIVLIILPTLLGLYITLTYSSKSFLVMAFNMLAIIVVLFLGYMGIRPHHLGFVYVLVMSLCVFIIFDGPRWLFIFNEKNASQKIELSFTRSSTFIVGTIPLIIILILSWPTLYKGAGNQFNDQFENVSRDYKNWPRGRYPDIISMQPPRNGFNYGQNYIFKTVFNLPENIKSGKIFLVSEDHHKVTINDYKLPTQYGALYYARHGSKRKSYDFGIHTIDINLFLKSGRNELTVWNNLSSSVYPTGIGVKLEMETNDGKRIIYRSDDLQWDVYTGILDGDILKEGAIINYELKGKDLISMDKHFIDLRYPEKYLHSMDSQFIEPQLPESKQVYYSSIELWIIILFSILGLGYSLLVSGIKMNIFHRKFKDLSRLKNNF